MCGITGIYIHNMDIPNIKDLTIRMRDTMRHRGPDDAGLYLSKDKKLCLGHTRLSIIDLSPAGHQPMPNEDETIWIVYNGEIYNFTELREKLIKKGHRFRSRADTEVIIHGYEEWGIESLLQRLRGMFAFALYDSRSGKPNEPNRPNTLILARDRLGIKPLYYSYSNGISIFASEIKAILATKLVDKEIDPHSPGLYLLYGSIPSPKTIYKRISALPPGHFLIVDENGISERYYYNLTKAFLDTSLSSISEEEAVQMVRSSLLDTIKCHLISDVPVGAFLSGGIDSTSIVALMHEVEHKSIKTVSVIFPDTPYDESRYSKVVAKKFETDHIEVKINDKDLINHLEKIFYTMDQPTIDGVNTYFVSWAAKQAGLKVAISGVGGDETFWGYSSFHLVPKLYHLASFPGVSTLAKPLTGWIASRFPNGKMGKLNHLFHKPSLESAYLTVRGVFCLEDVKKILNPDLLKEFTLIDPVDYLKEITQSPIYPFTFPPFRLFASSPFHLLANAVSALELRTYMANQLLRDTDVFSMVHSLEVRVPFVDHKLVELLAKIPAEYKAKKDMQKPLLVKALNNKLPEEIVHRPKQGFTFPFDLWMRNELKDFIKKSLNGSSIFNRIFIKRLLKDFYNHKIHWSRIWSLLVLTHWLK